ncbi:MAG: restriction endonuclease [Candidatus Acidiferrales bacterium]
MHHEIDIFVTVDPAPGYQAISVFECKNWKEPVGKNEIVNFSEKIKATNANKGFLIAKDFTQDAEAQAAKDGRMTLLQAKDLPLDSSPILNGFHMIATEPAHLDARLRRLGSTSQDYKPLDLGTTTATFRGQSVDLKVQLLEFCDAFVNRQTLGFRSETLQEGKYPQQIEAAISFAPGELIVNGDEIESAVLKVAYRIWVYHPAIISHFDVKTRGRAMTFAPLDLPFGRNTQVTLVEFGGKTLIRGEFSNG